MNHQFLAVDLGATSGRTVLGTVTDEEVSIKELTRFGHDIVSMGNHLYWDFPHLYNEIEKALSLLASQGITPTSIGIDTWGVDIVCFGADGLPLANPFSYRDPHTTDEPMRYFRECLPGDHVYDLTGIQVMNFNTLFQLSAMRRDGNSSLAAAKRIMFLPDALSYLLCGIEVTEYTIASTSQLLNPTHPLHRARVACHPRPWHRHIPTLGHACDRDRAPDACRKPSHGHASNTSDFCRRSRHGIGRGRNTGH